ncbi:MAG: HAD-IIIA family hydrolase [Polyangiaceae bacterium]|nr:HAD-IIIA family hydrolase [Polyangiaceae bacterium]
MSPPPRRGVILDRDGTLIDFVRDSDLGSVQSAFHPSHIRFLPGVLEGMRSLSNAGFVLAIATNQPGPAKGQIPMRAVETTHRALLDRLRAEGIEIAQLEVCTHHPDGGPGGDPNLIVNCECRKPKPGMLLTLLRDLNLDPTQTWMVGDSLADVQAGHAAGVHTALLWEEGRCEFCPYKNGESSLIAPIRPTIAAPRFDRLAALVAAGLV